MCPPASRGFSCSWPLKAPRSESAVTKLYPSNVLLMLHATVFTFDHKDDRDNGEFEAGTITKTGS